MYINSRNKLSKTINRKREKKKRLIKSTAFDELENKK
jgi:hypothetical protein